MGGAKKVVVIGGGPAGLMAATAAAQGGAEVEVFEAKPSVGRKFLLAGRSGLNLTHSEPRERFLARYGERSEVFARFLDAFSPEDLRIFLGRLGVETFIGSSGRVFPKEFKASATLRAWLAHLAELGVSLRTRHRWLGWDGDGALIFDSAEGRIIRRPDATILALGGASWPRMGSDAAWVSLLEEKGVRVAPLEASNCGVEVAWSEPLRERFAGQPLKNVVLSCGGQEAGGEIVITRYGLEGGTVYALSAVLREQLRRQGHGVLRIDLKRDLGQEEILRRLSQGRGAASLPNHLKKALKLPPPSYSLIRDCAPEALADPAKLAAAIKALPVRVEALRPVEEAISTAGGIAFDELTEALELKKLPSVFACGEMLDWDAPTGGYLLQGCFSTGWWVGTKV